ncbi:protein SENSITIVE TO PROTON RHIZOTOXICITY 1-like [Quillaja saponaria]|uniref:Protein SENSITIVE TO PROTON RHIZOTOXICITY 1-like n=1 Tax=Quillaja saponaria TaxID=32244 RepID=A0AAD7LG87_QUISA|nr:protein SENSITIVE TO PROTON RHIZOTOXICITY 1-like [Quillaja saponaria]
MSEPGESSQFQSEYVAAGGFQDVLMDDLVRSTDHRVPLQNLSTVRKKMDSLQLFLSESIYRNVLISKNHMDMVSNEIISAIHQIIVNGSALLSCSQNLTCGGASEIPISGEVPNPPDPISSTKTLLECSGLEKGKQVADLKVEVFDDEEVKDDVEDCVCEDESEIVEMDAVQLLAEHIHFCEICGKGFKRDANLRMHMRAHGNQFKTLEALAKPSDKLVETRLRAARFSCPFEGCNRNKAHKKFRPLKSVICLKNHFKRSHCPKLYSCNRCNKKSFSVLSDLKSHLKHCGESKWKCSCGTTFSRKDKLFGHMALFEGHMPAVAMDEEVKVKGLAAMEEDDDGGQANGLLGGFFDFDSFGSIENYCLPDMPGFPNDVSYGGA